MEGIRQREVQGSKEHGEVIRHPQALSRFRIFVGATLVVALYSGDCLYFGQAQDLPLHLVNFLKPTSVGRASCPTYKTPASDRCVFAPEERYVYRMPMCLIPALQRSAMCIESRNCHKPKPQRGDMCIETHHPHRSGIPDKIGIQSDLPDLTTIQIDSTYSALPHRAIKNLTAFKLSSLWLHISW